MTLIRIVGAQHAAPAAVEASLLFQGFWFMAPETIATHSAATNVVPTGAACCAPTVGSKVVLSEVGARLALPTLRMR